MAAVPALTNMGLFLAKQQGFFAAEGLNVIIQTISSSTVAVAQQLHGAIDITAGAYVSTYSRRHKTRRRSPGE